MKSVRVGQIFCPAGKSSGRRVALCGRFADAGRAKKMCQEDGLNLSVLP